jgi:hypothetical protein
MLFAEKTSTLDHIFSGTTILVVLPFFFYYFEKKNVYKKGLDSAHAASVAQSYKHLILS